MKLLCIPHQLRIYLDRGEMAPRRLMLFVNSVQIVDFQEADSGSRKADLDIRLQEGQINVTEYPLRAAAFANVQSVSLHLVSDFPRHSVCSAARLIFMLQRDAVGEEQSRVYYVGFRGSTRAIQKEASEKLVIPAANAAEAPLSQRMAERSTSQQDTAR